MEFFQTYRMLCGSKGVSPTKAALDMGFSNAAYSHWSRGTVPKPATLQKVADYFGVDVAVFYQEEKVQEKKEPVTGQALGALVLMPVIGYVKAGLGSEAEQVYTGEYEPVPVDKLHNNPQEFSVLEVNGDSMMPLFQPADRVICHRQEQAENGEYVVAILRNGESTIKKLHIMNDGSAELVAVNPYYPPIKLREGDRIWAKVTSLQRNF